MSGRLITYHSWSLAAGSAIEHVDYGHLARIPWLSKAVLTRSRSRGEREHSDSFLIFARR